jgi:hypothetical protein
MSRVVRLPLLTLVLCIASWALGACQSLAGIHDRTQATDLGEAGAAGANAGPSAACVNYCQRIDALCLAGDHNQAYADVSTCLGICALIPPGEDIEKSGNTLACRINQLAIQESPSAEASTLASACLRAGPSGGGVCGSDCESYCQLYKAACQSDEPDLTSTQYDQATCVTKCAGLADDGTFDTTNNYSGDTLQCRIVHTSAASVEPAIHCPHAQLQAQVQGYPCVDDPSVPPDCASFCKLELAECTDTDQAYEDLNQCMAVCNALPKGSVTDTSQNTIGCRKYHSYNAMLDPDTHCPHTGPGGDGACGSAAAANTGDTGNCDSYCMLAAAACSTTVSGVDPTNSFETTFVNAAGCKKACVKLDGANPGSGYSITAKGNNVQCRLLHVSRALSAPGDECAAALGAAPCK